MAIKVVVDKLEDVAEPLRELYAKSDDGKFRLQADGIEDVSGLKSALKKERDARESAEKLAKKFEGLDPEEVRTLMDRFGNDEDMKLIKEGKIDVVLEKKTEKLRKEFEKNLAKAMESIEAEKGRANRWSTRVLDNAIREAAAKVGLHANAIEDALFRGRTLFTLDDDGNAVQMKDGTVVLGKNGKTPFAPAEWLEGMRESAPHWFPSTGSGTGAPAGRGSGGDKGKKILRADFDKLSPTAKAASIREGIIPVDSLT